MLYILFLNRTLSILLYKRINDNFSLVKNFIEINSDFPPFFSFPLMNKIVVFFSQNNYLLREFIASYYKI